MYPPPGTSPSFSLMAIIEHWEGATGPHNDNTDKLFWMVFFKAAIDTMLIYLCVPGWRKSFLGLCSISVLLVNWVTAVLMAAACFLGQEGSALSPCSVLATASAVYAALPLPMLCFGILDYCLDDSCLGSRRPLCKLLRNQALLLLAWTQAAFDGARVVHAEPVLLAGGAGEKFLVCPVEVRSLVNVSVFFLTAAALFALLPFHSRVVRWVMEADRLANERLAPDQSVRKSDFSLPSPSRERRSREDDCLEGADRLGPPLWVSLTLAFVQFWLPYLLLCVAIQLCDLRMPAFVTVNLFWLECCRSTLEGLVFWARSRKSGPYSDMPENICPWQVYWHLSREAQLQQLPTSVFNQFTAKKDAILFV